MPKCRLDAAAAMVARCPLGKKKIDLWDEVTTGFVLEVRATGGKTYYLRYFDQGGRQRQLKIGGFGDISFDQARKAARRLRSEVVLGGDPLAAKQEKRSVPTYGELADRHIAHAKTYQRSWWSTEGLLRKHVIPRWGKLRLDEITPPAISQWLAEKRAEGLQPASVDKLRVLLSKSLQLALEWQVPGVDRNPVRSVPRAKYDNKRERYLEAAEADRLLSAAERSLNPQLRAIVHLLLLTGARVSELLHAEWRHVDLVGRRWHIPVTKNGRGRHVPLAKEAVDVLEGLPRFDGCPYVLPNPETLRPFVSIKKAWQTARREAGLGDVRLHDLRHTCASQLVNAGVDLYAVGKVLGHSSVASSQRYSHLANDTLLAAVEAGAARLGGRTE